MAFSLRKFRNAFKLHRIQNVKWKSTATKLQIQEIGSIEKVKIGGYHSGQCFLHRVFAYRGIILCPWKAQLLDRDDKESPKVETYYQALIDERDYPHTKVQCEVGKFLGQIRKTNFMFAISGLDQVSHTDIIPYKPTTNIPIQHYLFNKFFVVRTIKNEKTKNIVPKLALHDWRRQHLPWLYYSQVHKMTTDNMRVTAMSFYMGRKKVTHWWRYIIRVENLSKDSVILQGQRWGIYTGNGELQTVRGIGILGHLPVLSKESPAIQYSSHVTLLAPRGHMWGYYLVQKQIGENNRTFLCPVPSFGLESSSLNNPVKRMPK